MNHIRALVYRFFDLSYITRHRILSELNILTEDDEGIMHVDIIKRIIPTADQQNRLIDFWDKVNKEYNDGKYTDNPFKKLKD